MQRSTEGAGAGATVAEVLIGRVAIQVVQIGAHGAHKIRKSAHLEVLSPGLAGRQRSEEHTSELQSLMRISYAVFCLKKKNNHICKAEITRTYTIQLTIHQT